MAGFSEDDRERIRQNLLDAGREFFARYGLDKTTVSELASEAGISTGSFYNFFESKERLYLAVLEAEAGSVYADAIAALEQPNDPEDAVVAFLQTFFTYAEAEPLIRRLLEGDYRDRLVDATTEAERHEAKAEKVAILAPFVEQWQEAGAARAGDPEILALAVESTGFILLHEAEFDSRTEYEQVRNTLIELVAAGLLKPGTETKREQETNTDIETTTEPETNPKSEPTTEPETNPKSEPTTEPETNPKSEPTTEPETNPKSEPTTEPETNPKSESS